MQILATDKAPKAVGPYNQGISAGDTIYVSGQLPLTREGEFIDEYIYNQTIQCLRNIEAIVNAGGGSRRSILKVTIYLKDIKDFPQVNEAYGEFFNGIQYPARTTVEVSALPKNAKIEIDAVACKE